MIITLVESASGTKDGFAFRISFRVCSAFL